MITETTKIIEVNPEGIPEFLKNLPYWINWKPIFMDGKAKNCQHMVKLRCAYRPQRRKKMERELLRENDWVKNDEFVRKRFKVNRTYTNILAYLSNPLPRFSQHKSTHFTMSNYFGYYNI